MQPVFPGFGVSTTLEKLDQQKWPGSWTQKNPAISREIAKFSSEEALDPEKWHFPDGFFPLATMTAVHRSPERQDSVEQ